MLSRECVQRRGRYPCREIVRRTTYGPDSPYGSMCLWCDGRWWQQLAFAGAASSANVAWGQTAPPEGEGNCVAVVRPCRSLFSSFPSMRSPSPFLRQSVSRRGGARTHGPSYEMRGRVRRGLCCFRSGGFLVGNLGVEWERKEGGKGKRKESGKDGERWASCIETGTQARRHAGTQARRSGNAGETARGWAGRKGGLKRRNWGSEKRQARGARRTAAARAGQAQNRTGGRRHCGQLPSAAGDGHWGNRCKGNEGEASRSRCVTMWLGWRPSSIGPGCSLIASCLSIRGAARASPGPAQLAR